MTINTTIRSPGALLLGVFFAAVTARVVFDDAWNGAPFTVAHVNSVAALIGAIAAGHLVWPSIRKADLAAAIGLAAIFIGASGYIIIASGGRNAEAIQAKAAAIIKTNEERDTLRRKVAEAEADVSDAKADYEKAKAEAAKECGSGKKTKCEGREATRDNAAKDLEKAESHASMTRGKLSLLGPEQKPNAGYKSTAKVFEALGFGKADDLEARMILVLPFVSVMISEVGTLTFLGMAIGHRAPIPAKVPETQRAPEKPVRKQKSGNTPPRGPGKKTGRPSDQKVIDFVATFRTKHGRAPSGTEIRSEFPDLPKSTAFDHAARARIVTTLRAAA